MIKVCTLKRWRRLYIDWEPVLGVFGLFILVVVVPILKHWGLI